jgi:opacity protein-like surface antigen
MISLPIPHYCVVEQPCGDGIGVAFSTDVAHHARAVERFRPEARKAYSLAGLAFVLLLCVPAFSGDDVTLVIGRPMVGSAVGSTAYGNSTWDQQQSAKDGLAAGFEYRHWFADHSGFQLDYNRTSTNATFTSLSFNSSLSFPVTRHEISGTFVRRFGRSESKFHPFVYLGPGVLLFRGGSAPGGNVGWSAGLDGILGCGVDTPLSTHLSLRTAYRFHLFRDTDYGDPHFHPGLTHIQEPTVGLSWNF